MMATSAALRLLAAVRVPEVLGWPLPRKETKSSSRRSTPSTRGSTSTNTPATSPEQVCVVQDDWRKMSVQYADRPEDPDLVDKFLKLAEVPTDAICFPLVKLMLSMLQVLRATGLCREEMLSILALAAIYFREAITRNAALSNRQSIGCVLVIYAFLAQSHLIDEAASLQDWHMLLLREEWSLERVNKLLVRLFALQNYMLRVGEQEFKIAIASLRPGGRASSRPRQVAVHYGMERQGSNGEIIVSV